VKRGVVPRASPATTTSDFLRATRRAGPFWLTAASFVDHDAKASLTPHSLHSVKIGSVTVDQSYVITLYRKGQPPLRCQWLRPWHFRQWGMWQRALRVLQ
jgi:hypothetical protein